MSGASKVWGGRFSGALDERVLRYTGSLHIDKRLASYDILGSKAHSKMLGKVGVLSADEVKLIHQGLDTIASEFESGTFPLRPELEDIHMNIETRLKELIGATAAKLHSGRSRNDQVALDFKLYCLDMAQECRGLLLQTIEALVNTAERDRDVVVPACTHVQAAQPISWGHYLLAFVEMFKRDCSRLGEYASRHSVSPLGAGALSGSSLPLDPAFTAKELGFATHFKNSYDVVGDRDFALELLQIFSQFMIHVSRFAEDMVFLSSTWVKFVELPDALCTGSSMMPQKKNPDVLELMRGKSAGVIAAEFGLATLLKGLPSSYNRDLQEDKLQVFTAADTVLETAALLPVVVQELVLNLPRIQTALSQGYLVATDIAEFLVSNGVPFRESHELVGRFVGQLLKAGKALEEASDAEFREAFPMLSSVPREVLSCSRALAVRKYPGSAGTASVQWQIDQQRAWLKEAVR